MSSYSDSEESPLLPDQRRLDLRSLPKLPGEVFNLGRATLPISASFALQNIVQAFSIMMAGTLGSSELDIASYGFMFATCTGSMVAIGGATALDTLCGQAVTSTKALNDPTTLGRHLQQSLVVLSLIFFVLITPLWLVSGRIFVALGQETRFALGIGRFLRLMIPAGYFQMVAESLKKFCQVQGDSYAVGWITGAAALIGMISNVGFVRLPALGDAGVPLAFLLYQVCTVVFLVCLVVQSRRVKPTIKLILTFNELRFGIIANLSLAITGILTIATEWWSFEILALMAARLSHNEISAQSILMSADLIFTTMSLGVGVAASHRIGHLLGANKPALARHVALSPYILSFALGALELILIRQVRSMLLDRSSNLRSTLSIDEEAQTDFYLLDEAYHHMALLRLYWLSPQIPDLTQVSVRRIISCITDMRIFNQPCPGVAILPPLFIAGLAAKAQQDRTRITVLLDKIWQCFGMGNVLSTKRYLTKLWDHRGE